MSSKELKAFVDRIEGDNAVVLIGDEGRHAVWPLQDLPEGTREGSVLRVVVRLDDEATKQTEELVDSLIERLQRGE